MDLLHILRRFELILAVESVVVIRQKNNFKNYFLKAAKQISEVQARAKYFGDLPAKLPCQREVNVCACGLSTLGCDGGRLCGA